MVESFWPARDLSELMVEGATRASRAAPRWVATSPSPPRPASRSGGPVGSPWAGRVAGTGAKKLHSNDQAARLPRRRSNHCGHPSGCTARAPPAAAARGWDSDFTARQFRS